MHDHLQVNNSIDLTPPIIAMLHALLESKNAASRPIYLFQCVRSLKVLPFANELAALAERHTNVQCQVHVSQQTAAEKNVLGKLHQGRFTRAVLDKMVKKQQPIMLHACGPAGLIRELSTMITTRNQPQDTFRYEFFGPAQDF